MKWISTARLVMVLGLAYVASPAMAQQGSTAQTFDELSARLEQQDQQIRQLQAQVAGMQQGVNATPVSYAPGGAPPAPAAAPATPPCTEVGSDMNVKAKFWNGAGLMFETPNKDFTMHIGGWAQYDNVWWNQSQGMQTAPVKQTTLQGVAANGVGPLEDGDSWRRVRLVTEGTFWETFEYRWNIALENIQYGTVGLDEMWVGDTKIPVIGTVRVGHVKTPMGLEGDMNGSSRSMTFMERSSYSEAIELNQNFGSGIWFSNTYHDDRLLWEFMAFRPDNGSSSDFYETGAWGLQGRITGLPLYEDEGRHLLHLGISGGWRNGTGSGVGADTLQLRARPELRDDDPAAQTIQPLPNVNDNRLVDTQVISCNQEFLLGTELLYIRGPFSFQAEYGWNFLNNAQVTIPAAKPVSSYVFNGGYAQVAYTLTGENRSYDKKSGAPGRWYFGSQGPYENAFLVRDADGNLCGGRGAWEVAARFSYIDLNAGSGAAAVNGGCMNGLSLALNWYLNTNLTVMTDWVYNSRYDVPANTVVGDTMGFGTRVQLSF